MVKSYSGAVPRGFAPAYATPGGGQALAAMYSQPANFAQAMGGAYNSYAGGLAGVGKNYADAFGAYGLGLGTMASARANERSNMYGANAMAEAARQGSVSNLGTAALSAYGGASSSAQAAWAANQKALHGANAVSNLNLSGSFGGGGGDGNGFSAAGPSGNIASGSYGGYGGGGALSGLTQVNSQQNSDRDMPSQMLDKTLSGMLSLGQPAYAASASGMDQFYNANQFNERPYQEMRADLNRGFGHVGSQIGGVQRDLGDGYGTVNSQLTGLWDSSMGNLGIFQSPAQRVAKQREADLYQRQARSRDREANARMASSDFADYARRPPPMGVDYAAHQRRYQDIAGRESNRRAFIPTY